MRYKREEFWKFITLRTGDPIGTAFAIVGWMFTVFLLATWYGS